MSFTLPTDLDTAAPAIPLLKDGAQGKVAVAPLHFSTFAAMLAAIQQEQANVSAIWTDQQPLTNATEVGISRRWSVSAQHARLVSFGSGNTITLAADANVVFIGLPTTGTINNGDAGVVWGTGVYIRAAGAWPGTPALALGSTVTATSIGLGSVNNTADSAKPVSTAQAAAILAAQAAAVAAVTPTSIGLGNVNNTADSAKPVSTAQATAISAAQAAATAAVPAQVQTLAAATNLGRVDFHYETFAALQTAVAAEQSRVAASAPRWVDGTRLNVGTAPNTVTMIWVVASNHARLVSFGSGKTASVLADTNVVQFGSGVPGAGVGANGDLYVDWAVGVYGQKAAGAWPATPVISFVTSVIVTAPTVTLAVQNSAPTVLEFNFGQPMYQGSIPAPNALTVTKNSSAWAVSSFAWNSATKAIATMASAMANGDTALTTFVEGTGARMVTLAGNVPLLSFNAQMVVNNVAAASFGVSTTPFFTDTFTDVNGTALTAHTPDLTPGGGYTATYGTYAIQSNATQSATNGSYGAVFLSPASPTNDYQTVVTMTGGNTGTGDGPIVRGVDANAFMYSGVNGSPANNAFFKCTNGSEGNLTGTGSQPSTSSPRTYTTTVVGPCVTQFINGVYNGSVTYDPSNTVRNQSKFGFRLAGSVGVNKIDNLNAYSVTQGTPVALPFVSSATPVIWDTDIALDSDDISDGLVMHGLRATGEILIACVTVCTRAANAVNAVYAINNYKGMASIPIGVTAATYNSTVSATQINTIATGSYGTPGPGLSAPDAVALLRSTLNAAANNSVVIVMTGYATNISNLMNSPVNYGGDGINLTGMQLITAKVKRVIPCMGQFGYRSDNVALTAIEANPGGDMAAAENFFLNWPSSVPMYCMGVEIGWVFQTTANTALINVQRPAWGTSAMVFAARGTSWGGTQYWALGQGQVYSRAGGTSWIPDPTANKFVVKEFANPTSVVLPQINALTGS